MGIFSGFIYGLTLASDSGDATNDISVSAGVAMDRTNSEFLTLTGARIKRLDASWVVGTNQGGLDTGAIANTTYYVYVIKRTDTDVVDVIISADSTAPTMPSSYDYKRLIGWFDYVDSDGLTAAEIQQLQRLSKLTQKTIQPILDRLGL